MAKLIVLAGSLRAESWNRKVVAVAAESAKKAGATVTVIDIRDYRMPMFDEDLESAKGLPAECLKLKDIFKAHDGFLFGCPEYNSSITAVLKNTIDWLSRPRQGEKPLECFAGKVAGLTAASAGALGGLRGLFAVREILQNIQVIVNPKMAAVSKVNELWDDQSSTLREGPLRTAVEDVGRTTAELAARCAK